MWVRDNDDLCPVLLPACASRRDGHRNDKGVCDRRPYEGAENARVVPAYGRMHGESRVSLAVPATTRGPTVGHCSIVARKIDLDSMRQPGMAGTCNTG